MKAEFESKIELLDKLKLYHITITEDILEKFHEKDEKGSLYNKRFKITLNDSVSWQGGSVSLGNNSAYITVSIARMKQAGTNPGETVKVTLERDDSKYGFEVPEEFEEALRQDDEARKRFLSLSMGKQRAIIYIVIQLKSSEKRIDKSLFFMENLKRAPEGKITMRHVIGKDLP